jgi:signal transduction histidine kinase
VLIADDGPGFSDRRSESRGEGVGLRNTKARLQEMYGDRGRLELSDGPLGGALVTIELPVVTPAPVLEPAPA